MGGNIGHVTGLAPSLVGYGGVSNNAYPRTDFEMAAARQQMQLQYQLGLQAVNNPNQLYNQLGALANHRPYVPLTEDEMLDNSIAELEDKIEKLDIEFNEISKRIKEMK